MLGHQIQTKYFGSGRLSSHEFSTGGCKGSSAEHTGKSRSNLPSAIDDDTNPLFISAVRIFLDFVREKQGIVCPEKTCSLEELIRYLGDFQDEARTKKGERYSPSTIRVIRYSLNRVIALGRNAQEMRPYPTQSTGVRKKRKMEDGLGGKMDLDQDDSAHGPDAAVGGQVPRSPPSMLNGMVTDRCDGYSSGSALDQYAPQGYNYLKSKNTHQSPVDISMNEIHHSIDVFRSWLSDQGMSPIFETFTDEQIDRQLVSFFRFGKTKSGRDLTHGAIQTFRTAISQYLKQHCGIEINTDPMFETTRQAFHRALISGPESLIDKKPFMGNFSNGFSATEWLGIPVECIKDLYRSGALSVSSSVTLQRKVWLELTIFFRAIPCCPDQIFWNRHTFKISSGDHGVKYVELNPDVYNRYGCAIDRGSEQTNHIMVQRPSSPYCPVASFELYLKSLNPSSESLFTQPKTRLDVETDYYKRSGLAPREVIGYSSEPLTSVQLATMMESIGLSASIPFHFSSLSVAETDHVAWMRALTALELELQCQALQFGFPVMASIGASRTSSHSPTDSLVSSAPRTSVIIQAAPRVQNSEDESRCGAVRPAVVPGTPRVCRPQHDAIVYRSSVSSDVQESANTPTDVIDSVWRKKLKLDQLPSVGGRERSYTGASSLGSNGSSDGTERQAGSAKVEDSVRVIRRTPPPPSSPAQSTVVLAARNSAKVESAEPLVMGRAIPSDSIDMNDQIPTVEELKYLYNSGIFDADQPDTLQNKILFELVINYTWLFPFPKKLKLWTKIFFQLMPLADGKKCIALGSAASEHDTPVVRSRPNSKHCPAKAYEKYLKETAASKLHWPKALPLDQTEEWYATELTDVPDVNSYLARIVKKAKFPRTLTQDMLTAGALKNWSEALEQMDQAAVNHPTEITTQKSSNSDKSTCSDSVRPTVKRILEHYRKSKEDNTTLEDTVAKQELSLDTAATPSKFGNGTEKRPVIIVRPEIVILDPGHDTSSMDRCAWKQMISDALNKAITSTEWEGQIDDAIKLAQGVSNIRTSKRSDDRGSPICQKQAGVPSGKRKYDYDDPRYNIGFHPRGRFNRGYSDTVSESDATSDDEHTLYIADTIEDAGGLDCVSQHTVPSESEAHGSQRRKLFMPIKHSE